MRRTTLLRNTARALLRFRSPKSSEPFETRYVITPQVLGSGTYGTVRLAVEKATKTEFAVKIIPKSILKAKSESKAEHYVLSEIDILQRLSHPNIVSLKEIYQTHECIYLVMDLAQGGELYEQLFVKGSYTEYDARRIVQQVLSGVVYLHDRDIVHRDLKPENLLLRDHSPDADILITDFGLSKILPHRDSVLLTACGTPGYVAPEVLSQVGYGKPVDLWSTGVIAYCLLCGYTPFWGEDTPALFESIRRGEYEFEDDYWHGISAAAKAFIARLLQVDPTRRPTAQEALDDPWFKVDANASSVPAVDLTEVVKNNLQAKRTVQKAIHAVTAANAFQEAGQRRAHSKEGWHQMFRRIISSPGEVFASPRVADRALSSP
ncbi:hypothetical protein IWQ60_010896 [Tieghemiomyces parasiticus]|uniref:Protein kinase domain-containing protein n=1 Tax=Tieghemiomyces parasiticus TaxID=78921 RepID=A0A9W7ZP97_9FUNG|nr:hypothetical protein IWQ60_010896 [Tieghemiomyces parasiticus]